MPTDPAIDVSEMSLAEIARASAAAKLPPVDRWNPDHCGSSDMRIARDGTWFHAGEPIARPAMVALFSKLLRREADGSFVLVTPVEKLDIVVDDAPFVTTGLKVEGEGSAMRIAFGLNTGDAVVAGPNHPIRIVDGADGPRPYIEVRAGLDAAIGRAVYYELADLALAQGSTSPGVWSDGVFFALSPA